MSQPKVHYLKDYMPPDFLIDSVNLHIELDETETIVTSVLHLRRNQGAADNAPLVLDGIGLTLLSLEIDGKQLEESDYKVADKHLTIFDTPNNFVLETKVSIKPQENTLLMGLYKSRNNYCTQCESQGFRRITYYLDRPDVMAKFTTAISADKNKYPMLLSNGNLIEERELKNNRHWVLWEDPSKKPSYLFALVAGDFDLLTDTFTTMSGRNIDLRLYLEKGFKVQGDFALQALKRAMRWDEEAWGREYDLDMYMVVAVTDFNMGAMENKGLNIFNTKYILAKPDTATDQDYINIENVIGHEYFHNWSGNRVTCRDWFQITLKEGLTVFRDQSFTQDMIDTAVIRINNANYVQVQQFAEDASPLAHPIRPQSYIEINNFYTITVYRKGAEVIRMVQTILGKELFRQGMDNYFQTYDGQAVTTENFINAMEVASGRDFTQFKRWYDQAGTPLLTVTGEYNAAEKTYTMQVKQQCPPTPGQKEKLPFHIPLAVGLVNARCEDMPLQFYAEEAPETTKVLEITEPQQSFTFINVDSEPTPALLRNFSAPVEVEFPYTDAALAHLWLCDSDPFSRFSAGQTLMTRSILQGVVAKQQGADVEVNPLLVDTYSKLLTSDVADLALLASLLSVPSLKFLMSKAKKPDVTTVFESRKLTQQTLAKHAEQALLQCYKKLCSDRDYQFNAQGLARRTLKNYCLAALLSADASRYAKLAYQQFTSTNNMTDCMGALMALNNHSVPERTQALEAFYEKWQREPLVVNKWLILNASSSLSETLDTVKAILHSDKFDRNNPNNIYSLVCVFGENQIRFHDVSGAGYDFISEQALMIDRQNSVVAGRIVQPLTRWQQIDDKRGEMMRQQLERIAKQANISDELYELVNKSLAVH